MEIVGADGKVCGIVLADSVTGERRTLDVTGVFVAIGHDPRTELVKGQVDLDDAGYVTVAHPTTATNLPGVFACGDVVTPPRASAPRARSASHHLLNPPSRRVPT